MFSTLTGRVQTVLTRGDDPVLARGGDPRNPPLCWPGGATPRNPPLRSAPR